MYRLKYGLNWLLPACGVGKKINNSPNRFLVYQALDIETNLKERMRIIKTLDGESWDGWDTIHVEKELLEIKIETKNIYKRRIQDKVILTIRDSDNSIFDFEIKVNQITFFRDM